VSPSSGPAVAVDLGGSKALVALADGASKPIRIATAGASDGATLLERIAAAVLRLTDGTAPKRLALATAGTLDLDRGTIVHAANLPFRRTPVVQALVERLGTQVVLVGDGAAAAAGEFAVGGRGDVRHGLYITVSTGIGMGMLLDGRIYVGDHGSGGELGHMPIALRDPEPCACGRRGCLEAYASGSGIVRRTNRMLADGQVSSVLGQRAADGLLEARDVLAAAGGDDVAQRVVEEAVEMLAIAVGGIFAALRPQVIVMGGGLMLDGALLPELRRRVEARLRPDVPDVEALLQPAVHGERSVLEGARAIARGEPAALGMGTSLGWAAGA
jgi:glucokinase